MARSTDAPLLDTKPGFTLPGADQPYNYFALAILLLLWATHVWASWGEITSFSGDYGSWLYAMKRFAGGEVEYRDFQWLYPPGALWFFGSIGKILGTRVEGFRAAAVFLSLLVYDAFFLYVSRLLPRSLRLGTITAGFLLSAGYAQVQSAPVPSGMYTPAAPLGFLFLLCAIVLQMRLWRSWSPTSAAMLGVACGLCLLTKQDMWLPAVFLAGGECVRQIRLRGKASQRGWLWIAGGLAATVAAGGLLVMARAGWNKLVGIPTGFGWVSEFVGRGLPTLERLTLEVVALGAVLTLLLFCLTAVGGIPARTASRTLLPAVVVTLAASALHVYMTFRTGLEIPPSSTAELLSPTQAALSGHLHSRFELLRESLSQLLHRTQLHLLPAILPAFAALCLASRWKKLADSTARNPALYLLGLCIVARGRRAFEYVEWYQMLLEIPVYVLVVLVLVPEPRRQVQRGLQFALAALVLVGAYSYWFFGMGAMTRRGRGELVTTVQGQVRMPRDYAEFYRRLKQTLDSLDPTGRKPLFGMGYTAGFDYFLDRRDPSPVMVGFGFSGFSEDVFPAMRKQSPFLLDNSYLLRATEPVPHFNPFAWEQPMEVSGYGRVDHRLFESVLPGCEEKARIPRGQDVFTLYDCP